MYILVEIIHTEFQYISLIEMQKYNWNRKRIEKREIWKKRDLLSRLVTRGRWQHLLFRLVVLSTGTKGHLLFRLPDPGQKGPLLSRTGVPGWETGTTGVSQSEQINVFVVATQARGEFEKQDSRGLHLQPLGHLQAPQASLAAWHAAWHAAPPQKDKNSHEKNRGGIPLWQTDAMGQQALRFCTKSRQLVLLHLTRLDKGEPVYSRSQEGACRSCV